MQIEYICREREGGIEGGRGGEGGLKASIAGHILDYIIYTDMFSVCLSQQCWLCSNNDMQ